jgi:FemAB-related protein (PEP-CTERM system-associated)
MQNTLIDIRKGSQTYTGFADPRLNDFVKQQTTEPLYYSREWLDLIAKLYGYSMIPLITSNATGQITGFLPLCFVRSPLTGHRLVSLPFSDHCPLLAVDETSANDLIDQAIHLALKHKVRYLELRSGVNDVLAKRSDFVAGSLYASWLTPLTADPNMIWSQLKASARGKVRKSQKLGVQIHVAQHREDMVDFFRLHLRTRSKKHGMPAQTLGFFFELWDTFAASGVLRLLLAEYMGRVIASSILMASGMTVRHAYGASDERYLRLAPNNLLIWEAITWACRQGYQTFDHGRTARDNLGLMEFKRNWGAVQSPLPYFYYPFMAGLAATSEHSWKFRLLTACWKRLPLQVAGPLGGYLYKHLG